MTLQEAAKSIGISHRRLEVYVKEHDLPRDYSVKGHPYKWNEILDDIKHEFDEIDKWNDFVYLFKVVGTHSHDHRPFLGEFIGTYPVGARHIVEEFVKNNMRLNRIHDITMNNSYKVKGKLNNGYRYFGFVHVGENKFRQFCKSATENRIVINDGSMMGQYLEQYINKLSIEELKAISLDNEKLHFCFEQFKLSLPADVKNILDNIHDVNYSYYKLLTPYQEEFINGVPERVLIGIAKKDMVSDYYILSFHQAWNYIAKKYLGTYAGDNPDKIKRQIIDEYFDKTPLITIQEMMESPEKFSTIGNNTKIINAMKEKLKMQLKTENKL